MGRKGKVEAAPSIFIGTAGWTVPKRCKHEFPEQGTHLERYAGVLNAVEINSSFYRPHQPKTYARWAACVPPHFKFSVKLPKEITHKLRFVAVETELDRFLAEATSLGNKLGPILVQLPPSFAYDAATACPFFELIRSKFAGQLVFEPRHASWFQNEPEQLLVGHRIARVGADPPTVHGAQHPGGWTGLRYLRLHGSPRIYYSEYSDPFLAEVAAAVAGSAVEVWCIFDNTALDYAATDALRLRRLLEDQ
jgi:uncharacterized protein YecE (DUF72 family)